jgi:YD repeat-containing protein
MISHDSTGKITQFSFFEKGNLDTLPGLTYHYIYAKTGKLSKIICPVVFGSITIDTLVYEFDKSERLIKRINKINRSEYKYDGAGNIIEKKDIEGSETSTTKFSYNKSSQVIKFTSNSKKFNKNSELLYNKNGILILTKTKKDKGTKGSESFETEIREYSY